ncbi:Calx-beta domain-containing protein [Planktothricoides sp. SR001]|uniref:Calx-beta domain-containing protein n=1 Tax=Planktothricoides sp. SR001 TaxID=1705388 RepID=UPI0006C87564|nr:Calx-beta domain-containing protein [Planktothricoides sp. SR001]
MKSLTSDAELLNVQVSDALQDVENSLKSFATEGDYDAKMQGIFGDRLDGEKARVLAASWVAGDFSAFPAIEVRDSAEINGAWGAFAQATGKIYLSRELVNAGDVGAIGSVLLEEYGHYIDAQVNYEDALGDEGELFAAWVEGQPLNESDILTLKAEDDSAVVVLDGQEVSIEQKNIWFWEQKEEVREVIQGTNEGDLIQAGPGDTVYALGGNDNIDYYKGVIGGEYISLGEGDDLFKNYTFREQKASITVDGGPGNDNIEGTSDNDTIIGGSGGLSAGGGLGDDLYIVPLDSGVIIGDAGGNDTIRFESGNLALIPPTVGQIGIGTIGTGHLVIDTNKNGVLEPNPPNLFPFNDMTIQNFYTSDSQGKCIPDFGFIETVGNLSGQEILDFICNQKDTPTTPTISITNAIRREGDPSPLEFKVTLSEPSDQVVTVAYRTEDGTATTQDKDYAPPSGVLELRFEPGETQKKISIYSNYDKEPEGQENFYVKLSDATNAELPSPDYGATGTILDGPDQNLLKKEQKATYNQAAAYYTAEAATFTILAAVAAATALGAAAAAVFTVYAGLAGILAARYSLLAQDPPDPNFTTIAEPITPSLSQQPFTATDLGSQQLADAANAMIANQTQWIGVAQALQTSLDRADGAVAAGDEAWQKQQEQAAQKYTLALGALTDPQPQLFADFFNAYQAAGLPAINLTVSDVIDYQNQLRANGLSPEMVQTLTELGADSVTQQEILQNILTLDPNQVVSMGGGVFPNALIDNSFRDSIIASAAAFDQGIIGAGFTDGVVAITIPTPNVTSNGLATGLPPNANIPDTNLITLTDGPDTALPTVAAGQQILGLSGQDNLTGTTAADQINGNQGTDTINGSNGDDTLWGGKGSDQIDGGADNDLIYGNKDNDILNGGDGNDTLHGGQRRDILTGGAGDDILAGELGQDILTGDAGNDTFILAGGEFAALSLPQADVIMDFTLGDKIGLAGGLAFADLTLETISLSLNNAAAITATALKAGGNYLGIVAGIAPATLTADVFVGV